MRYLKTLAVVLFLVVPLRYSHAQDTFIGRISEVLEEGSGEGYFQKLSVVLEDNKTVVVENNSAETGRHLEFKKGDKVMLQKVQIGETENYIITDYYRTNFLLSLFIVFALLSVLIGKKYGLYSLLGMGFSVFVIFKFILPSIVSGKNPVLVTLTASLFIIPVTFYLSHGFNKKTHIAIVSTFITLLFTSLLTSLAVNLAHLTGYSSDEAMFLQVSNENINMKGILLAGIIIGFLGVLDDVTVSQASIVSQLKESNREIGVVELYKSGMQVGRDHIASMTNTLVLVYTGASLPLLLLFMNSPQPFSHVVSTELIADEIVRTLVGSIGLILAVPLSTFLSAIVSAD